MSDIMAAFWLLGFAIMGVGWTIALSSIASALYAVAGAIRESRRP